MIELAEFQRQLRMHPELKFLFFELTDSCNLHCKHCGSNCSPMGNCYLSVEIIEKVLSSVSKKINPQTVMMCLTGGEPFLHPDIIKIVALCRDFGFPVGITSNGTLIDEKMACELAKAGLNTISISLDGVRAIHDSFRCHSGCFESTMKGIRCLRKYGFDPEAMTVIHSENIAFLDDMFEFLMNEGFSSWRIVNVEPIGRAVSNSRLLLSHSQLSYLFSYIRKKRFDIDNSMHVTYGCSHFVTLEYENEIRDYYFQCGAGIFVASVMSNGDIGACLDIERRSDLVMGNVYKDDFMDIWENKFHIFRTDRTRYSSKCKKCDMRELCLGDSFHTWDFDNNIPKLCFYKGG